MRAPILVWPAIALALLSTAFADDAKKGTQRETARTEAQFKALDRNADGRLSKEEANMDKHLAQNFAAVDANTDGFVSSTEFMARPSDKSFE